MIIVGGRMDIDSAEVTAFVAGVAELRPKVLAEAGCHHYSLLVEDAVAGIVNVLEWWEDEDALAVHLAQPWTETFSARFGKHITAMDVRVFAVASERPLTV